MTEPRSHADRVDRWLSIAAGIGALCAVAVSLYQAALARQQLRASAWPYVEQSNSHAPGQPYVRRVENVGVGPARVRSFVIRVDGRPMPTWGAVVRALAPDVDPAKAGAGFVYSSLRRGNVLPPGTTRELVRIDDGPVATAFWRGAQERLTTIVCYCSIYDECWRANSDDDEPTPVRACTIDPKAEFTQ